MEATSLNTKELLMITGGWSRKATKCVIGTGSAALVGAASRNPFIFIGNTVGGYISNCM